jgi:branched-chain amino acid transport system permease protein
VLGFPFWAGGGQCHPAAMGLAGVALERVVIRPILGQPAFSIVMLTIGIGYVLRGLITMVPASAPKPMCCPCPTRTRSGLGGSW